VASDLHAVLTARIDELERLAQTAGKDSGSKRWVPRMMGGAPPDVAEHIAAWDPSTVLRGLAEDRDILRRHRPSAEPVPTPRGPYTVCVNCSDLDGAEVRIVGWPCWDALSLARRLGVDHG
jgi:hypothetical protein